MKRFDLLHLAVIVCLLVGIGVAAQDRRATEAEAQPTTLRMETPRPKTAGELLRPLALPPGPLVLNLWLQGCHDCMPSFHAWASLYEHGAVQHWPVVNVAYGDATREWARLFHVDKNLVMDSGEALVRPLGIRSFTTVVLTPDGREHYRGHPTDDDYVARVNEVLASLSPTTASL